MKHVCSECYGVRGNHFSGCPEAPDNEDAAAPAIEPDDEPADTNEPHIPDGPYELPDKLNH